MDNMLTANVHDLFMSRAIELAKQGRGHVSPNPMVGCVLVHDGDIIGEGYHEEFGGPHAEIMAIRNARKDPVDSIAYINLEPCCITGKTPPCTTALIENGISEVYVGMLDPNPVINGKGVEALEKAGIAVRMGILEEEAIKLNQAFNKWITKGMPWVIAKVAQSADGYMGINSDSSIWLTGDVSRTHAHTLRSEVDAVLIGRQTALIDDPNLTVREVRGENPKRVIMDTNRKLPLTLNLFNDKKADTIVLCSDRRFTLTSTHFCKYLPVKEEKNKLSPIHALKTLAMEGISSVLIEGGQEILKSFIAADVIDQIFIYTAPEKLDNAGLKNPIQLSEEWLVIEQENLGEDTLIIAEKGVECLQEL
ncbi:MAG: bifunctional diaminohydroxyphosphoribosylaminopyrimidine deaminase/5-amino-6-(5-phosphoribosylamino)uracil reductase RibD [Candidatus Marinimicrobia bacterium]|nr:bifunctional diaminohydroxyphosphoribosylaminopyrimidine deaminase/5-amino-6-(5-phosphoribosylamino)uracil reductase RibD [Candidatus Neomarinimicrobiota bacterium]